MKKPNLGSLLLLSAILAICTTSCSKSGEQAQTTTNQPTSDPAQANLAPPATQPVYSAPQPYTAPPVTPAQPAAPRTQSSYPPPQPSYPNPQPAYQPAQTQAYYPAADQNYAPGYADTETYDSTEATEAASYPPPPLPDYSQPPAPADNYLWNPGYWGYTSAGYYWVPGIWVVAPFVGALWTPPYWAFVNNRYLWHHGYWGQHVGFYGGVNYGCGYVGRGYEGGYWNHDHFAYNRSVNNINTTVIHNVYNYRVTNITNVRISYNGGRGGLNLRPIPAEVAALHEQRLAPLPAQVEHMHQAATNREQFNTVNQGRPKMLVAAAPLATPYRAPAAQPRQVPGARVITPAPLPREANRVNAPLTAAHPEPVTQPAARNELRPAPKPAEPARPTERAVQRTPVPEHREPSPQVQPREGQPRPEQPRPEQPRVEQPRPEQPRVEQRRTEQPRTEEPKPPQPRPEASRPSPEPRAEPRQAPQPHQEARPENKPAPHPEARPREEPKKDEPKREKPQL